MAQHDAQQTGKATVVGPTTGKVSWSMSPSNLGTTNAFTAGTVVGSDGTIYAADINGRAYAINPGGTIKYTFDGVGVCCAPPVIGPDGTIYFSGDGFGLTALNPDFTLKWIYTPGGNCCGTLRVGTDGTVYVIQRDSGLLHSVNPVTGLANWVVNISIWSMAISTDGNTIYAPTDTTLFALNKTNGSVQWQYKIVNRGHAGAVVDASGNIYVASDSSIVELNSKGSLLKTLALPTGKQASAIAWDATTLTGGSLIAVVRAFTIDATTQAVTWSTSGAIYALNPTNTKSPVRWSQTIVGSHDGSINANGSTSDDYPVNPIIDKLGNIYIGTVAYLAPATRTVSFYGFNASGKSLFPTYTEIAASDLSPAPLITDVRVLSMDSKGVVYMLPGGFIRAFK
jgi:sugar lactone lactonase YvrE